MPLCVTSLADILGKCVGGEAALVPRFWKRNVCNAMRGLADCKNEGTACDVSKHLSNISVAVRHCRE
jgi:hypothetical protein